MALASAPASELTTGLRPSAGVDRGPELVSRLWQAEFLRCGRPPRPLPADSLFARAVAIDLVHELDHGEGIDPC